MRRQRWIPAGIVAAALAALTPCAHAYNQRTHQQITQLSYEIMRRVEWELNEAPAGTPLITDVPPDGVSAQEWQTFLDDVSAASAAWRLHPAGLPAPQGACTGGSPALADDWGAGPMGRLEYAPAENYRTASDCAIRPGWRPSGIFNESNAGEEKTGEVLGFWGATVDDEFDDTHLWVRPTSAGGVGALKDFIDDAVDFALGAVVWVFVCLFDCIFDDCDCPTPDDIGDEINPVDDLEGLIPGVGDVSGSDYVGFWHHISMGGWSTNEYDDRRGMLTEEGGWGGSLDPVEVALIVGMDATGMSMNYEESQGIHRYTIDDGDDGHEDTESRSEGEWQFTTFVHTPMEPVDNLAYYGWREFRDSADHETSYLGWPLHALGDAIAPHHVIASSAWGHRPFEDAYDGVWWAVRYQPETTPFADADGSSSREQREQARRVLQAAWEWRQMVIIWRLTGHGATDVPVRDMVTELAQRTFDYASGTMVTAPGWPYDIGMSTAYLFGGETVEDPGWGIEYYEERDADGALARPLFEEGMAAQIGFLTSAAEVLP